MDISKDARGEVSANHASETAAGADTAAIAAAARAQANDVPAGDGRHHGRGHVRGHGHVHLTQTEAAAAAAGVHVTRVHASANGTVALPADVDLRDITVDGKDLVVHLPDGSLIVIVDGAAHTPHIQIGEVVVPPDTIAALIQIAQTEPAAGPPPSSGGNFEVPAGDIGPGLGLSPLLPPTELSFGTPQFQQVQGFLDLKPTVVIVTPDQPVGVIDADSPVHEAGLPARGSEPPGSDQASNSEFTTGTIVYTAGDGATTVSINGMLVTSVGQSFADTFGTLTITSIAPGAIGFSFQLEDNTLGQAQFTYPVHVADSNGSTADATLTIHVVDDVPTARADTDATVNGTADGNVMTGVGTTSGSAGADTQGADGASVSKVASNNVPANVDSTLDANHNLFVHGQYGDLTLNADGSYTYVRNAGTPGGVTDTFNYTLTDGDGSTSSATLTISIPDLAPVARPDTDSIPTNSLGPATGNVIAGSGETNSPAGADTLGDGANAITQVSSDNVPANVDTTTDGSGNFVVNGQYGVLTINAATGDYSYARNAGTPGGVSDVFHYTLTDADGDSSSTTLTINIAPNLSPPPPPPPPVPPTGNEPVTVTLDEKHLPDGTNPINADLTQQVGTTFKAGSSSLTAFVFSSDLTHLIGDSNGVTAGGDITWHRVDDTHIVGNINGDTETAITLTLTGPAGGTIAAGATDSVTVTAVLSQAFLDATGADHVDLGSIGVTASGTSGSVTDQINVTVLDDAPTALDDTGSVATGDTLTATALQGVLHNDTPGADHFVAGGGVVGVDTGSDTSTPVSGNVGTVVHGTFGDLTLNADGSYTYEAKSNQTAGSVDHFVYTVQDADGDTATAKLDITVQGTDLLAGADQGTVNEAGLPNGSNAPSNSEIFSGDLSTHVSGGSGGDTFTLNDSPTGTHGTLNLNSNGTYTYTLTSPVDESTANNGVDTVSGVETFHYTVTDSHGNTSISTITIDVVDDVPSAANDSATGDLNNPVIIDVLANDTKGADGVANSDVALNTGAAHGTVVYNGDGTFTYTQTDTNATTDSFTYTITDGDGDVSTATVNITMDKVPVVGPNATVITDDDALAGGNAGGVGDVNPDLQNTTGTLSGSGGDGALTFALDTTGAPSGFTYQASGSDILIFQGATKVLTVTLNAATGAYTVTQNAPVMHAAGGDENNQGFTLNYTVTDTGGDSAPGTLSITVNDDTPTAAADTGSVTSGAILNVAASGVLANDHAGADGYAAGGAIVGVAAGSNTSTPVSGNVGTSVGGSLGTLTLFADGHYSYDANPNASGTDTFVYTIEDGDGDKATTTLTITVNPSDLAATNDAALVNEAALSTGSNPSSTAETFAGTVADNVSGGAGTNTFTLLSSASGTHGTITFNSDGTYSYTLTSPVTEATANNGTDTVPNVDNFTYQVTDADGNTATGVIHVSVVDDVPSFFAAIQNETASNNPADAHSIGTLHFTPGADTPSSVESLTLSTTATVGGHGIIGSLSGNVLTGYVDVDNSHTVSAGDTVAFTLTVNPTAGTSGQYDFDLQQALDGTISTITVGGSSAFGAGPAQGQILTGGSPVQDISFVTGFVDSGEFSGEVQNAVNGSTVGWGVNNNVFDVGEEIKFDFNVTTAFNGPLVTFADFQTPGFKTGDHIAYQAFYQHADGTSAGDSGVIDLTGAPLTGGFEVATAAGSGLYLDYVRFYDVSGNGKITLVDAGVQSLNVNQTLSFSLAMVDHDGDQTTPHSFTINVADGNTPAPPAAPVVLDLTGGGLTFVDHTAGVTYDYLGNGSPQQTAWVGKGDGFLAVDLNHDGTVTNASEWVFANRVPGATSDLQAVAAEFDTNHDGKLTAADAQFGQFGVWQDANGDGVAQPGEFKTLSQLGIVSIDLVSDGKAYTAANGEVEVQGTASFTRADGTTGLVGDVSLNIASSIDPLRAGLQQLSAANSGLVSSLVAAGLIASVDTTAAAAANLSDAPKLPTLDPTLDTQSTKAGAQTSPLETTQHDAAQPGLLSTSNSEAVSQPAHSTTSSQEAQPLSATLETAHDAASTQPTTTESDAHGASGVAAAAAAAAAHSAVGFLDGSAMPIAAAAQALAAAAQNGMAGPELAAQVRAIAQVLHDALGADHAVNQLLASLPAAEQAQGLAPGVAASLSAAPADGAALAAALAHATLSFGELGMVLHLDHGALVINHA